MIAAKVQARLESDATLRVRPVAEPGGVADALRYPLRLVEVNKMKHKRCEPSWKNCQRRGRAV
jgi:hypothetical protein